ncbi:MAG: thiamine-phosphate kinase [Gammaproteobacteria bacterium]|nr:thiamine-phosphate kinase [Gammaproteobacteria bacterium]
MQEFSLIERYCKNLGWRHSATRIGVGDDAAVVQVPDNMDLAISVDTMVEGVHFTAQTSPQSLACKLLAVNLSDMAAMGARPKWATLAMTLPRIDESWLQSFSGALDKTARHYKVQMIGGDTTRGSRVLSLQIMGLLAKGKGLTRSSARPGDDLYVSGTLGDPALALAGLQSRVALTPADQQQLLQTLETPQPQVELGMGLLNIANACIDISDGLVGDLTHICSASGVSILVDVAKVPLSTAYQRYRQAGGGFDFALSGGDDYQLAFTVEKKRSGEVINLATQLGVTLTRIGTVLDAQAQPVVLQYKKRPYHLKTELGYQHFVNSEVPS